MMTIDEKIDMLLNELKLKKFISQDDVFRFLKVNTRNQEEIKDYNLIRSIIVEENVANKNSDNLYYITQHGVSVVKDYGGWIKYNEHLKQEQNRKQQKEMYDLRLAKWQANTFWYWFFIAIVGGISGIIALVIELIE